MAHSLTDEEKADWIQLIRTPNIGPITFYRLIKKFGTAAKALSVLPEFSRQAGRKKPLIPSDRQAAQDEIKTAWQKGIIIIAACEAEYPTALRAIADPPPIIFVNGHVSLFEKPAIAIIGARNASGIGRKFARQLSLDLGQAGYVITSGLARGIDGAAHGAALETGTIAVVAGGVDHIYPPEHDELTANIAKRGAIISERHIGAQPTARDFPKRNRIISGLSRGVVIVEAAAKSGTLITARYALEQGREVFAVPGSPLDPRSQGANRLIRDGATLVENADDIIQAIATQTRSLQETSDDEELMDNLFGPLNKPGKPVCAGSKPPANMGDSVDDSPQDTKKLREDIFAFLSYSPIHRDEIIREFSATSGMIADALLDLVLCGEVTETSGGFFARDESL